MFDLSRVGKQIKKYRINADMTQMELAERMGVSFQAVSSWERSETMPDISRLVELGEIFQVSVDEILDHQEKTSTVKRLINPQKTFCKYPAPSMEAASYKYPGILFSPAR